MLIIPSSAVGTTCERTEASELEMRYRRRCLLEAATAPRLEERESVEDARQREQLPAVRVERPLDRHLALRAIVEIFVRTPSP